MLESPPEPSDQEEFWLSNEYSLRLSNVSKFGFDFKATKGILLLFKHSWQDTNFSKFTGIPECLMEESHSLSVSHFWI